MYICIIQLFPYDGSNKLTIKWDFGNPGQDYAQTMCCANRCGYLDKPKRQYVNVKTPKRRQTETSTHYMSKEQNIDNPKQQQVNILMEMKCRHR